MTLIISFDRDLTQRCSCLALQKHVTVCYFFVIESFVTSSLC